MSNDVSLNVGIDLDVLKNSADKAAEVLGHAFSSAMQQQMSSMVLGNGLAPTLGPGAAGAGKSVESLLEKVLASLDTGFSRMVETQKEETSTQQRTTARKDKLGPWEGAAATGSIQGMIGHGMTGGQHNPKMGVLQGLGSIGHEVGALATDLGRILREGGGKANWYGFAGSVADKVPGMGGWSSALGNISNYYK